MKNILLTMINIIISGLAKPIAIVMVMTIFIGNIAPLANAAESCDAYCQGKTANCAEQCLRQAQDDPLTPKDIETLEKPKDWFESQCGLTSVGACEQVKEAEEEDENQ